MISDIEAYDKNDARKDVCRAWRDYNVKMFFIDLLLATYGVWSMNTGGIRLKVCFIDNYVTCII